MDRKPKAATKPIKLPAYSSDAHPEHYQAGQATANRLIDSPADRERISWCLAMVEAHLAHWPVDYTKNGLTEQQHARSRGFRDTLREYLAQIGE
jgi:hypothetical protein